MKIGWRLGNSIMKKLISDEEIKFDLNKAAKVQEDFDEFYVDAVVKRVQEIPDAKIRPIALNTLTPTIVTEVTSSVEFINDEEIKFDLNRAVTTVESGFISDYGRRMPQTMEQPGPPPKPEPIKPLPVNYRRKIQLVEE